MPTGTGSYKRLFGLPAKTNSVSQGLLAPITRARPAAGLVPLARLMEESERALQLASASTDSEEATVASRITGTPETFRRWESEHVRIVGRIAEQNHRARQATAALSHTFTLVHNKSLFEYLREQQVRSTRRRQLIEHFHGNVGYVRHVVHEYENYLRAAASYICLRHIGSSLLHYSAFEEPLDEYEEVYAHYFRCYCQWAAPDDRDTNREAQSGLLAQQKTAILEKRKELLAIPAF